MNNLQSKCFICLWRFFGKTQTLLWLSNTKLAGQSKQYAFQFEHWTKNPGWSSVTLNEAPFFCHLHNALWHGILA